MLNLKTAPHKEEVYEKCNSRGAEKTNIAVTVSCKLLLLLKTSEYRTFAFGFTDTLWDIVISMYCEETSALKKLSYLLDFVIVYECCGFL